MTEQWLNSRQIVKLLENGEIETGIGKVKLTDYVHSRVKDSQIEALK